MAVVSLTPLVASPRGTAISWVTLGSNADTHTIPNEANIIVLIRTVLANTARFVPVPVASRDSYSVSNAITTLDATSEYVFGPVMRPELFDDTGVMSVAHGTTDGSAKITAITLPVVGYRGTPDAASHATRIPVDPVSVHQRGQKITWTNVNANGHVFTNSGNTYFFVDNASGSSVNVTVQLLKKIYAPNTTDFQLSAMNLAVAAGTLAVFGPFAPGSYNNTDGTVQFNVSSTTSVRVASIEA